MLEVMRFDHNEHTSPSDYIYWGLFLRQSQQVDDDQLLSMDSKGTLELVRHLTEDWNVGFRPLFDAQFVAAAPYRIATSRPDDPPVNHEGDGSRVVLIGDAPMLCHRLQRLGPRW
jgi:hypothetical protein